MVNMIKSKRRRLLLVTNNMYTMRGGERWAQELATVLKEKFEIRIIFPDLGLIGTHAKFKKVLGIHYRSISGWSFKSGLGTSRFDFFIPSPSGFISLISAISRSDVVYCISSNPMILSDSIILSKIYKKRIIYGAHNPLFAAVLNKNSAGWKGAVGRALLSNVDAFHVLNSTDYKAAKHSFPNADVRLIPNFTYNQPNSSAITVNKQRFVVLFVGTLLKMEKGLDFLSEIIDKTMYKTDKIYFNIIGPEGDAEALMRRLTEKYPKNVQKLGFMNEKELKKQYSNADLFILTSRKETFGLALLEAQSHGLPAVCFDVGGPSDIISENFQGRLIKNFNTERFADAIFQYYLEWATKRTGYLNLKRKINRVIIRKFNKKGIIPNICKLMWGK